MTQRIYCCNCLKDVEARLTSGEEVYPGRFDLAHLPFWRCPSCLAFVGCHHKTRHRTRPLGCIPSAAITAKRKKIHAAMDPVWRDYGVPRKRLYARLSQIVGFQYHTAELRTIEDCDKVLGYLDNDLEELVCDILKNTSDM